MHPIATTQNEQEYEILKYKHQKNAMNRMILIAPFKLQELLS